MKNEKDYVDDDLLLLLNLRYASEEVKGKEKRRDRCCSEMESEIGSEKSVKKKKKDEGVDSSESSHVEEVVVEAVEEEVEHVGTHRYSCNVVKVE